MTLDENLLKNDPWLENVGLTHACFVSNRYMFIVCGTIINKVNVKNMTFPANNCYQVTQNKSFCHLVLWLD